MITPRVARGVWFPGVSWTESAEPWVFTAGDGRTDDAPSRRIHVLMIEDDPAIAEMYRLQLEHDGYGVTVATTGEVAESTVAAQPPDIVLLDLLLPDRSGFEVLASLNDSLPNHPPVVILSNYSERDLIARGLKLGALDYLIKSQTTPTRVANGVPTWLGA